MTLDGRVRQFLDGKSWSDIVQEFEQNGYVVFKQVLDETQLQTIKAELAPLLANNITGRNDFEGRLSNRIYALVAKSASASTLVEHPLVLRLAEQELGASCLLSACLAINLLPGETAQAWHFDDSHLDIPRPRRAYGLSAFWAIDETTELNGATEVIPGSHLWGDERPDGAVQIDDFRHSSESVKAKSSKLQANHAMAATKVTLPAGSLMLAKGTLWHRGGANQSASPRMIITPQYCPGWARQLENMLLSVPPDRARSLPPRVRELIGYSIHPPFMGYVDGVHPEKSLLLKNNSGESG